MLQAILQVRRQQYESKIRDATYELKVAQESQKRWEKTISELSGAIYEIDRVLKDLAAPEAAKENTDA